MTNLYPTTTATASQMDETTTSPVNFGRSYLFDFDVGDFVTTPTGQVVGVSDISAYVEWCKKALRTPRYRYLIYSRNYGSEFDDMIGKGLTKAAMQSEIERITKETIMADPRTAKVDNFTFTWGNDSVYVTCDVTTTKNETVQVGGEVVTS